MNPVHRLALRGYRLHSGAIFYIQNDDPEDFQENLIANWDGTPADAYEALQAHNWPTSVFVLCACGTGEADFGGECDACNRETIQWVKASA